MQLLPHGHGWLRLVTVVALSYAVVCLVVYLRQYRLLYIPTRKSTESVTEQLQSLALVRWPPERAPGEYLGLTRRQQAINARGTVLLCHGNAGTATDRYAYLLALEARGMRTILLEYRGYADRNGQPREPTIVADASSAIRAAHERYGAPVYVWGESLGSGVAAAAAAANPELVAGLVLITPWDSLPGLAQHMYPYLPVKHFCHERYESTMNVRRSRCPVAILMAEYDEVIPPALSQRLYDHTPEPRRLWVFPGAGHNTWPVNADATWWDEVLSFLKEETT